MSDLLSRKFIYAILAIILGFILVVLKEVTGDTFLKFVEIVGGLYILGNVSSTVANKLGKDEN